MNTLYLFLTKAFMFMPYSSPLKRGSSLKIWEVIKMICDLLAFSHKNSTFLNSTFFFFKIILMICDVWQGKQEGPFSPCLLWPHQLLEHSTSLWDQGLRSLCQWNDDDRQTIQEYLEQAFFEKRPCLDKATSCLFLFV